MSASLPSECDNAFHGSLLFNQTICTALHYQGTQFYIEVNYESLVSLLYIYGKFWWLHRNQISVLVQLY